MLNNLKQNGNTGRYTYMTMNPETMQPDETIQGWEVSVYYDKGGTNMFSGANEARGIRAMIAPYEFKREAYHAAGQYSICMKLGDSRGLRGLLLPLKAYSPKKLALLAEKLDAIAPEVARIAETQGSRAAFERLQAAMEGANG